MQRKLPEDNITIAKAKVEEPAGIFGIHYNKIDGNRVCENIIAKKREYGYLPRRGDVDICTIL